MSGIDYEALARAGGISKGEPRKRRKGRQRRHAAKVVKSVRAKCVERDGYCRVWTDEIDGHPFMARVLGACEGISEWAHLHVKRRSQTRGLAPEVRHTTADSLMLCKAHHDRYDGRQRPRLTIAPLTDAGCNGRLRIT